MVGVHQDLLKKSFLTLNITNMHAAAVKCISKNAVLSGTWKVLAMCSSEITVKISPALSKAGANTACFLPAYITV